MIKISKDSFESQIKRAESAINRIESDEMRVWLSCILNVLKWANMQGYRQYQGTLWMCLQLHIPICLPLSLMFIIIEKNLTHQFDQFWLKNYNIGIV